VIRAVAGLQAFHDGRPIEFLYLIRRGVMGETWRVRPLFVIADDRDEFVATGARLSLLHTGRR
jgi:hypothetical protein